MRNGYRLNVRFSNEKYNERNAWEYVYAYSLKHNCSLNRAVIDAINRCIQLEEMYSNRLVMLKDISEAVRKEVANISVVAKDSIEDESENTEIISDFLEMF